MFFSSCSANESKAKYCTNDKKLECININVIRRTRLNIGHTTGANDKNVILDNKCDNSTDTKFCFDNI